MLFVGEGVGNMDLIFLATVMMLSRIRFLLYLPTVHRRSSLDETDQGKRVDVVSA
jgi:precorrin-4 methylase